MWFLNIQSDKGQIKHEKWIEIAKSKGIPTMIDMAADVPPVENLWKFNDMGFDLVCVSGGKAMRGPQSAGILMGKKTPDRSSKTEHAATWINDRTRYESE